MANNKNRIQTYVNDSTHERLKYLAESKEMSVSGLVAEILQTVEQDVPSSVSGGSQRSPYVTREEMIAYVTEVVARAEQHWETSASSVAGIFKGLSHEMAKEMEQMKKLQGK